MLNTEHILQYSQHSGRRGVVGYRETSYLCTTIHNQDPGNQLNRINSTLPFLVLSLYKRMVYLWLLI